MALILTGSSGSTTLDSSAGLTFSDSSNQQYAASPYVLKNRIINGAMVIDQRNAGASVTPTNNQYTLDRWASDITQASKFTVQQVSGNANTTQGYQQSLKVTSSSAYSVLSTDVFDIKQQIEGYNIADFAWGTSGAKTVTLSFWVYSSLTGTFGGSITNDGSYSYAFSYTISSANTWTQVSVTIPGSTAGTWNSTNGTGLYVRFNLGCGSNYLGTANTWLASNTVAPTGSTSVVGTNGATWYLTGVQLEVGSTATPFERRLYNQELANCQRYYETCFPVGTAPANGTTSGVYSDGVNGWCAFNTTTARAPAVKFLVTKRANPTVTLYNAAATGTSGAWGLFNGSSWVGVTTTVINAQNDAFEVGATSLSVTANYIYLYNGLWAASAEL